MLAALRETRAAVALPAPVPFGGEAPLEAQRTPNPPAGGSTPPAPAVELPRAVADAVALYAFGDPVEAAANHARAVALLEAGRRPADIVRELRQGANPETFV